MTAELEGIAKEKGIKLAKQSVNNVLTYALFPQVGLKFLQNSGNPDAFEPAPGSEQLVSVLLGFWPIFSRQIWYYQPLKGPSRC